MKSKSYLRRTMVFATILVFTHIANAQTTISIPIIANEDEAEEFASEIGGEVIGTVHIYSSDLELVFDSETQFVGMIFRDVQIPAYSTIISAYIQFQVDRINEGVTDAPLTLEIYGAKEANIEDAFDEAIAFGISAHPATEAKVIWQPGPSVAEGDRGLNEQTEDISTIISEIVAIGGWVSGNNLMIVITGDPEQIIDINREMESYDGDASGAPTLNITSTLYDFARNEEVCQGEAVQPLIASGDSVIWYSEPDFTGFLHSGNIFQTGKSEPGSYTFYVTSTFSDTILEDTASLIISEGFLPTTPETSDDTIYCPGDQMADITAPALSGGLISWYNDPYLSNLLGTGELYNPFGITSTTTYYVTETVGVCESLPDEVVINIRNTTPYEHEKICLVTVDHTMGKNMILWEKTPDKGTALYNVYRETNTIDIFEPIGILSSEDPGVFIDNDSDPAMQSYKYKIASVDICGNESALSDSHSTMHLSLNAGINEGTNLLWSKYSGFEVQTYNIWRGSSADNMFIIGSVSGSNYTFTDLYPLAGTNIYQVEVVSPFSCTINTLKSTYSSSFSNIASRYSVAIEEFNTYKLRIFPNPNPTSNITTLEYSNPEREEYQLIMTDMTGKVIKLMDGITTDKIEINRDGLADGLYFIELKGPRTYRGKILFE